MKPLLPPIKRILLQVLLLLLVYAASRSMFSLINLHHFKGLTLKGFLDIAFHALRYDLSAITVVNGPYILLFLLPLPLWRMPRYQALLQYLFVVLNAVVLLFEISDWAYYPYNFKRATADVLNMVSRKGDFWSLLPRFVIDYWFVPVGWILITWLLARGNKWIVRRTPLDRKPEFPMWWIIPFWQTVRLVLVAGLAVIAIRGGTQYVPIGIRNAVQVTDSRYVPVLLNTPFSIINSFSNSRLEAPHYFDDSMLSHYVQPLKQYGGRPFRPRNVVVIILESYSKEFTKLGGGKSYTPFLDSLMDQSLVCTQAYANALHSAEGIPAVLSGLPSLMDESITTSVYGANKITALPNLLKPKGYSSAFYHGGTNGTMSFDVYTAGAGFDKYYGRYEYNNEKDYDGNWGIWDEPFFQYFARGLSSMRQPFVASIFSLSSHPPYKVPQQYEAVLPKGSLKMHTCVAYTDMALRKFFATASTMPWFRNTLFVITPDHCSPESSGGYYESPNGHYAIPLVFYAPGDSTLRGTYTGIAQQIDILPSVIDYLGYDRPFFAFGNSIFRPVDRPAVVNYINSTYQYLSRDYLLTTKDTMASGLYAYPADSACRDNILAQNKALVRDSLLPVLKAWIQAYRSAVVNNQLMVD